MQDEAVSVKVGVASWMERVEQLTPLCPVLLSPPLYIQLQSIDFFPPIYFNG